MKAGNFNIHDYLEKLHEVAESLKVEGGATVDADGIIIPDENKKSYDWLKKEYQAGKTEVKVEVSGKGSSFEPGYDLQTNLDAVKDFKPGMFGAVKTAATTDDGGEGSPKQNLDTKKDSPGFAKGEGEGEKKEENPKTEAPKGDIKDNEEKKPEGEKQEKAETPEKEKEEKSEENNDSEEKKTDVKKIDLKTKKA